MSLLDQYTVFIGGVSCHFDTILVSSTIALMIYLSFYYIVSNAKWNQCTDLQNTVEMMLETATDTAFDMTGRKDNMLISTTLVIFIWTLLMNSMDILPSSIGGGIGSLLDIGHFALVPTEDINTALALALSIVILSEAFKTSKHGLVHFISQPLGYMLFPLNIAIHTFEITIKVLTMSLRLFGNMVVGKVIAQVISMFNPAAVCFCTVMWTLLHASVIVLQPFILTQLLLIYIGRLD